MKNERLEELTELATNTTDTLEAQLFMNGNGKFIRITNGRVEGVEPVDVLETIFTARKYAFALLDELANEPRRRAGTRTNGDDDGESEGE